jgi:ribonuclease HI
MSETWTIYTDGGSRGNPGPAAYAYVIKRPGQADIEVKCFLGKTTNNIAEYTGMLKALEHAKQLGGKMLLVNSDSELMVKQMTGVYRVKNEGLIPLFTKASLLRKQFDGVVFKHVYRDQNSHADALCNEAMDDRSPLPDEIELEIGAAKPSIEQLSAVAVELTPMMQAIHLLKQSAAQWAESGDATTPAPAEVLNRLCEILLPSDDQLNGPS